MDNYCLPLFGVISVLTVPMNLGQAILVRDECKQRGLRNVSYYTGRFLQFVFPYFLSFTLFSMVVGTSYVFGLAALGAKDADAVPLILGGFASFVAPYMAIFRASPTFCSVRELLPWARLQGRPNTSRENLSLVGWFLLLLSSPAFMYAGYTIGSAGPGEKYTTHLRNTISGARSTGTIIKLGAFPPAVVYATLAGLALAILGLALVALKSSAKKA